MFNTKLYEIIFSLNHEEQKRLLRFLADSSIYKDAEWQLINYVISYLQSKITNENDLEKKIIFAKLFPGELYNEHKINKLISDCNKSVEMFIIAEYVEQRQFLQKMALIKFYQRKKMKRYFESEIKNTSQYLLKTKESLQKLNDKVQLNEIINEQNTFSDNRQSDYLDFMESLQLYNQLAETKYTNAILIHNQEFLIPNSCINILLDIHHQINKLLQNNLSAEDFQRCFDLLISHSEQIEGYELKDCVIILISIAIKQVHQNIDGAQLRLFELYKFLIDNNLILEEDKTITSAIYKNVTTIGLYLQKYDFVELFVEDYKNNLNEHEQEDVYSYNKAHLLYYKKEYERVLQLISTTKYKDVFYRLSSRVLLIKTYFELEKSDETYFDLLANSVNAFKKYVYTNDEINNYYKIRYKNFIKYVLKLTQLNRDKIQIQKFIDELISNKDIIEYAWLLKCANKLM